MLPTFHCSNLCENACWFHLTPPTRRGRFRRKVWLRYCCRYGWHDKSGGCNGRMGIPGEGHKCVAGPSGQALLNSTPPTGATKWYSVSRHKSTFADVCKFEISLIVKGVFLKLTFSCHSYPFCSRCRESACDVTCLMSFALIQFLVDDRLGTRGI